MLVQALNSAFSMANFCQRAIGRGENWKANSATLADWLDFLETLSNDADFWYLGHPSLLAKGDGGLLQTNFEKIAAAALKAQLQISAKARPTPEARGKAVGHLRDLMKSLQDAAKILGPAPEGKITGCRRRSLVPERNQKSLLRRQRSSP